MRIGLLSCLLLGCAARSGTPPVEPVQPTEDTPPVETTGAESATTTTTTDEPPPKEIDKPVGPAKPVIEGELYSFDEALRDVLASPLVHLGTGEWFGMFQITSCAYKNDRVFVVNLYCSPKEMTAFGLVVLSPKRGRAYLYAEGKQPISKLKRSAYITFKGETSPPWVDAKLPAIDLGFSWNELRAWDEKRAKRAVPACFGGMEMGEPQNGCLPVLADHEGRWSQRNKPMLDAPSPEWFKIINALRDRARTDGKAAKAGG